MTKILYIYGDDDYAVVKWEELDEDKQEIAINAFYDSEEDYYEFEPGCYIEIIMFELVDEKFVSFLFDESIIDYENSKHRSFEVIAYD